MIESIDDISPDSAGGFKNPWVKKIKNAVQEWMNNNIHERTRVKALVMSVSIQNRIFAFLAKDADLVKMLQAYVIQNYGEEILNQYLEIMQNGKQIDTANDDQLLEIVNNIMSEVLRKFNL